jgi:hypothetical protein
MIPPGDPNGAEKWDNDMHRTAKQMVCRTGATSIQIAMLYLAGANQEYSINTGVCACTNFTVAHFIEYSHGKQRNNIFPLVFKRANQHRAKSQTLTDNQRNKQ